MNKKRRIARIKKRKRIARLKAKQKQMLANKSTTPKEKFYTS